MSRLEHHGLLEEHVRTTLERGARRRVVVDVRHGNDDAVRLDLAEHGVELAV
jgi:hypothetical protein